MPHLTMMIHKVRCCSLPVQLGVTVDNAPGSTDTPTDNANDTDGEHLTRDQNCKSSVTILHRGS